LSHPDIDEMKDRHRPPAPQLGIFGDDDERIEPRPWLLGNTFCRRAVSSIIATGGTGKTSLRIVQALAMTTLRNLTDEYVFRRSRVLLISLEDDRDELRRRVRAARQHYGIRLEDTAGWLFLAAPKGLKLATMIEGRVVEGPLVDMIRKTVKAHSIDLVSIDPFVKAHGVEENDNNAIDAVVTMLAKLAIELDIAIDCPHHTNKGLSDPGNADKGRGASAFKDGARLVYSLTEMAPEDAAIFGISDEQRRHLVRVDSAKVNIAPKATGAKWFSLESVPLDNGTDEYPNGDNIQVVRPWYPPDIWQSIPTVIANAILDDIDRGLAGGSRYSNHNRAGAREAWTVVQQHVPAVEKERGRKVVATWIANGVLVERDYHDPTDRKDRKGLFLVPAKRPS
jgi:AAA domain